jgi:hypothetical protein
MASVATVWSDSHVCVSCRRRLRRGFCRFMVSNVVILFIMWVDAISRYTCICVRRACREENKS